MGEPAKNSRGRPEISAGRGATGAELGSFLLPMQSLEEFPNKVAPYDKRRNLTEALDGAERGE